MAISKHCSQSPNLNVRRPSDHFNLDHQGKLSQYSFDQKSKKSNPNQIETKITDFIHSIFGQERDRMNRLVGEQRDFSGKKLRHQSDEKRKYFRMISYEGKEKNELWKKNFHVKHTSMALNMAVVDLFKDRAKDKRLSLSANKQSKWEFVKGREENNSSELSTQKRPDLQGVYDLKYSLIDKSAPSFIYRKEKKSKRKQEEDAPKSPLLDEKRSSIKPSMIPIFSKMKSRKGLIDVKDYRLIDNDELEDQRYMREIETNPANHYILQERSRQ